MTMAKTEGERKGEREGSRQLCESLSEPFSLESTAGAFCVQFKNIAL